MNGPRYPRAWRRPACVLLGHEMKPCLIREEGPYRFTFCRCLRCGADGPTLTEPSNAYRP